MGRPWIGWWLLAMVFALRGEMLALAEDRFARTGPQAGEQIPNVEIKTLDGDSRELHKVLGFRGPTLLLTSSLTCPKSRSTHPGAQELAKRFKGQVDVVVLYVIEAHPEHDICPYKDVEDVTAENRKEGILRRQPRTFEQRLKLAEEFKDRMRTNINIYVDPMGNQMWKGLGEAPNVGLLVDEKGIVIARQAWFAPDEMAKEIQSFLDRRAREQANAPSPANPPELKKSGPAEEEYVRRVLEAGSKEAAQLIAARPEVVRWQTSDLRKWATVLQRAVQRGNLAVAEVLLQHGADGNARSADLPPPLHMAAQQGNAAMVALLIKAGADVNIRASGRLTAIEEALVRGHMDAARKLLAAGAEQSFFTDVALGKTAEARRKIAADGSIVDRPDGLSRTPLFYAIGNGNTEMARLLIDAGAAINTVPESLEESPLHWAAQRKQTEMARLLLNAGADVNCEEYYYGTPLHRAVEVEDLATVRVLLEFGADTFWPDDGGYTPLHHVVEWESTEMAQALLAAGADLDQKTDADHRPCGDLFGGGEAPLLLAVKRKRIEMVRWLLDHGADVNAEDKYRRTAWDELGPESGEESASRKAMRELLRSHGAHIGSWKEFEERQMREILEREELHSRAKRE